MNKMTALKDQAVCLRVHNYSETSQIVTLFGRASGRVRTIAKGSRRARARFGGGIDMLTAGHVVFFPARSAAALAVLGEFQLTESFAGLRRRLRNLYCAQYAAEMIAEFTEDLDPHQKLYDAFYQALQDLSHQDRPEITLLLLELTLLREVGLAPDWHNCAACSRPVAHDQNAYFSSGSSGLICRKCASKITEKRPLNPRTIKILQNPQPAPAALTQTVLDAHELLSYHQRQLLGKQTKIMTFVNQLLRKK